MATRCNIFLRYGNSRIWLYRHWDGYPASVGPDIHAAVRAATKESFHAGQDVLERLMALRDEDGRAQYRLTSGQHGDIDWLYGIDLNPHTMTPPRLLCAAVRHPVWPDGDEDPIGQADAGNGWVNLDAFVRRVNTEILALNNRVKAHNARNGTSAEEFPLIWAGTEQNSVEA